MPFEDKSLKHQELIGKKANSKQSWIKDLRWITNLTLVTRSNRFEKIGCKL